MVVTNHTGFDVKIGLEVVIKALLHLRPYHVGTSYHFDLILGPPGPFFLDSWFQLPLTSSLLSLYEECLGGLYLLLSWLLPLLG